MNAINFYGISQYKCHSHDFGGDKEVSEGRKQPQGVEVDKGHSLSDLKGQGKARGDGGRGDLRQDCRQDEYRRVRGRLCARRHLRPRVTVRTRL